MSNETLNVINSRRSIRKYKNEQIGAAELQQILNAGLYAPSAMNQQAWHFSVVQSGPLLDKIKAIMKENFLNSGVAFLVERASAPGFIAFHGAPTVIIISADEKASHIQLDCGAAAENMALAAQSLDIGSCIFTSSEQLFAKDKDGELKKELGIPEGYRHVCAVALGYKDGENPSPAPRKEDLITYL